MLWLTQTLWWYLILFLLGLIFFPITAKIFGLFFDKGYAFSKSIAILVLTYSIYILGILKVLPFFRESLILLALVFLVLNYLIFKGAKKKIEQSSLFLIITQEVIFLAALLFWVYVRGQEPSIRGLEKFMDFGFINSILKSKYFPPLDMWLSKDPTHPQGYPINYYYFGHLTGALISKLSQIPSFITYNLILATIFALSVTQIFSLSFNIVFVAFENIDFKKRLKLSIVAGILGTFLVNLAGNLHTIYAFTKGYPNEAPVPFWQILSSFNPTKYWYPNATRFIPFTIHEFPIYSYVVADLHGHVFAIPFVSLTLAVLFLLFVRLSKKEKGKKIKKAKVRLQIENSTLEFRAPDFRVVFSILLGFLTAVHYMTNAFDGPIYLLLTIVIFFALYRFSPQFFRYLLILLISFLVFVLPFSSQFSPFASGIGVNCSPSFLANLGKLGPFLFEKGNCQVSPLWMLFVLWGFFWFNFVFLLVKRRAIKADKVRLAVVDFVLILFGFGFILVILPEIFYIKDIYPGHFRANTMFKLGYQSFMISGVAISFAFVLNKTLRFAGRIFSFSYFALFALGFFLVALYPSFAITSYYGNLSQAPSLKGDSWLESYYPEYKEIIDYLNKNVQGQPTILEAQGDSYTDFNVVSAYTGLPTVAGWWVHEWLWRGSSQVVGDRISDIETVFESEDLAAIRQVIKKYGVEYIILGANERNKYKSLKEERFDSLGTLIFTSSDGKGKIYHIP